ncbi:MAG TPA: hypothetical protein VIC61_07865 [Gammaproteobacteria bacterium]
MTTTTTPFIHDSVPPLRYMRVRILRDQAPITFFFPVAAALALCLLLWDEAPRVRLVAWALLVFAHACVRFSTLRRPAPVAVDASPPGLWSFAAGAFTSGLIWGIAPLLLVTYDPSRVIEFTLFNGLILLVICGLTAGAALAYAASLRVLFCFAVPALIPSALHFISIGDRYNSALGGFILLYFLFIAVSAMHMNFQLQGFARAEHERDRLLEAIARARARIESGKKRQART